MFSLAFASEAAGASNPIVSFIPIIVLVFVFYFFIIRPQQKKLKEETQMRGSLRVGDKVVTTSGIFASVVSIDDKKKVVSLEIAKNVNILVYKSSIAEVLTVKISEKDNENKN